MKDYLKESLNGEEVNYVLSIIKNTSKTFMKKYYNISEKESFCVDDDLLIKQLEYKYDEESEIIKKILDTQILKDTSILKPYTKYQQEKIAKMLDDFAQEVGLEQFVEPLTFNEKLVVFLLYIENYQVNEITILLNVSRMCIWKRDKSIKNKIKQVKEKLDYEK